MEKIIKDYLRGRRTAADHGRAGIRENDSPNEGNEVGPGRDQTFSAGTREPEYISAKRPGAESHLETEM